MASTSHPIWISILSVFAINAGQLTYPDDIATFDFEWTNPDQDDSTGTGPADGSLMTDGIITSGSGETLSNVGMWGDYSLDDSVGMVGAFRARTLNLDSGFAYWSIDTAELIFDGGCFDNETTADAKYYDYTSSTQKILSVTITVEDEYTSFTADIDSAIKTNGYFGFDISSNMACEGSINILEFILDGEQSATTTINDFRLGVQLHDGNSEYVKNPGAVRYSDYLQDGGDWSVYAGDHNYYDPDAFRIGLFPSDPVGDDFYLEDTDFRFGIQLTDRARGETGNANHEGEAVYTPWASEAGGWSEFAGDSNYYDFDAVRVTIETREDVGLVVTNVKVGTQLTDLGTSEKKLGSKVYSEWLSGEDTWTPWGSDNNWYDPDSVAIYLGVETNRGNTPTTTDAASAYNEHDDDDGDSKGLSASATAGIVILVLFIVACLAGTAWYVMTRRGGKAMIAGVEPVDDEVVHETTLADDLGDEKHDMAPIGMDEMNKGGDQEEDKMIGVKVTETAE